MCEVINCKDCEDGCVWSGKERELDNCPEYKYNKPMFHDAKVGDRVWSIEFGWGKITDISIDKLLVCFKGNSSVAYHHTGQYFYANANPTLFWDEVTITPPPKPKCKVQKWRWVAKDAFGSFYVSNYYYEDTTDLLSLSHMSKHKLIQKIDSTMKEMYEDEH